MKAHSKTLRFALCVLAAAILLSLCGCRTAGNKRSVSVTLCECREI